MTKPLQQPNKTVSISEAAQILGVSLDTIRRWDKTGLLHSERPDGKNRYFSLNELNSFKLNQPLSISETSYELHISPTTLRRLVKKNLIHSSRNSAGERVFHKEAIKDFLKSDYYIRRNSADGLKEKTKKAPEPKVPSLEANINEPVILKQSILAKTNWQLVSGGLASMIIFILLTAIGITNIQISTVKASQPVKTDSVAIHNGPYVIPLDPKTAKTKSFHSSEATSGALLQIGIGIGDDGLTYHIEPASSSARPVATDSATTSIDPFLIESIDSKGYHLKLPDGSLGFIPFEKVNQEAPVTNE